MPKFWKQFSLRQRHRVALGWPREPAAISSFPYFQTVWDLCKFDMSLSSSCAMRGLQNKDELVPSCPSILRKRTRKSRIPPDSAVEPEALYSWAQNKVDLPVPNNDISHVSLFVVHQGIISEVALPCKGGYCSILEGWGGWWETIKCENDTGHSHGETATRYTQERNSIINAS